MHRNAAIEPRTKCIDTSLTYSVQYCQRCKQMNLCVWSIHRFDRERGKNENQIQIIESKCTEQIEIIEVKFFRYFRLAKHFGNRFENELTITSTVVMLPHLSIPTMRNAWQSRSVLVYQKILRFLLLLLFFWISIRSCLVHTTTDVNRAIRLQLPIVNWRLNEIRSIGTRSIV